MERLESKSGIWINSSISLHHDILLLPQKKQKVTPTVNNKLDWINIKYNYYPCKISSQEDQEESRK